MTGWWLASYLCLWVVTVLVCVAVLGTLRELALARGPSLSGEGRQGIRSTDSGPEVGSELPDLALSSANGCGFVELPHKDSGTQTLLAFLTPMCEGCHTAASSFERLIEADGTEDLDVQVVISGPERTCRSFLTLLSMHAPVFIDSEHAVTGLLNVHHFPSGLLYGGDNVLVRKGVISSERELAALLGTDLPASPSRAATAPDL
jgi:peroxiredoxin